MRILIVDDHEATTTFMRLAFASNGHTVATASNIDAALTLAAELPLDVVLTDLTFGDAGGGLELATSLRSNPATESLGILAVSGADLPALRQATLDRGFDGFVAKPVDLASLLASVDRLGAVVAARRSGPRELHPESAANPNSTIEADGSAHLLHETGCERQP